MWPLLPETICIDHGDLSFPLKPALSNTLIVQWYFFNRYFILNNFSFRKFADSSENAYIVLPFPPNVNVLQLLAQNCN